jgi:hypothetical protein
MRKKLLAIGSALAMTLLCASTASALAIDLTVGDANYVGVIIDGIPPNDDNEPLYVNSLIQVAPGDTDPCLLAPSEECNREDSTLAIALPAVPLTGQLKTETDTADNVLVNGWAYISGKYGNDGIHVWYIGNLAATDTVTLPTNFDGITGPGLSHWTLYTADQFDVPDGGTTAALLGLSLVGLGMIRRRFNL